MMLRTLLGILLVAAAACKPAVRRPDPASLVPAAAPAPAAATEPATAPRACDPCPEPEKVSATIDNGWITVALTLPAQPSGPLPVVISPIVPDADLLDRGFGVVRFHTNWELLRGFKKASEASGSSAGLEDTTNLPVRDEDSHTVGSWLLAAPRPGIVGRAYFEIISTDAEHSIPRVIDWILENPRVDPQRIAITGSSTSGFTALQAMAHDPRIAVGVVRVACGDYLTFLRSSSLALNDDPRWLPNGKLELDPDYAVEIAAREPIRNANRYPPRPLLLLAGELDRAIPYACVENTVTRFRAAYEARGVPDHFRFVPYSGQGHNLAGVDGEVLGWLERWLKP
ncbi:MAG TPA: prolyl oligopeptidase family serine peptidase [Candidatus Binatia bacterium]